MDRFTYFTGNTEKNNVPTFHLNSKSADFNMI